MISWCFSLGALGAFSRHWLGVLPPPSEPRLAGVRSAQNLPEAGKPAAGWGRVGEGGGAATHKWRHLRTTALPPPPTPPHKGEGRNSWRGLSAAFNAAVIFVCGASIACAQSPSQPRMTIGYVEVAGDARYEPVTGFGRLVLKHRERPFAGAQVGLDEAQAL